MGVEFQPCDSNSNRELQQSESEKINVAPLVLGLQPAAMVDHVAKVDWALLSQIPGERGGSFPVWILLSPVSSSD